jgi:hypothetical protein
MAKISAQVLSNCVDVCKRNNPGKAKYLACVTGCEDNFLLGDGNTVAPDGKGGKVFSDTAGGKVFIDANGGKVFAPPGG